MIADLVSVTGVRMSRPCLACGGSQRTLLYTNAMARIAGLDLSYQVVQCQACGAASADELAAPADYGSYYHHCSKYDTIASVTDISQIDRRRADFAAEFVTRELGAERRVLDLGCGAGVLLAELARLGWRDVRGLDPAPNAGAAARKLFGIEGVRCGSIDRIAEHYVLADFDLVCLTAVLEHMVDPVATLRALARDLRPGAALLLEVPALESFGRTPMEAYGELSIEHINFFSRGSLTAAAARAGLRPITSAVMSLWPLATDCLFMLFTPGSAAAGTDPAEHGYMPSYLAASERALRDVLERAAGALSGTSKGGAPNGAVIWGAGSHTARLLPQLGAVGLAGNLRAIVDANPNLQGRSFGGFEVLPPEALAAWPGATVIASSFRAGNAIAARVSRQFPNPVCQLYPS